MDHNINKTSNTSAKLNKGLEGFETFINVEDAYSLHLNHKCLFIDCTYSLKDENYGQKEYTKSHLPGAIFVDLNKELSSQVIANKTGRHPLPSKDQMINLIEKLKIDPTWQLVAYDMQNGALAAARFWWLMKWAGHQKVAVLMGGKQAWAEEYTLHTEHSERNNQQKPYPVNFNDHLWIDAPRIQNSLGDSKLTLVDARANERYSGKVEPIDPIAGHIPGAINIPFEDLLQQNGLPKSKKEIQTRFDEADKLGKENLVFYCGSGVTACFNLLLYQYAFDNLEGENTKQKKSPLLYPGSWSDWITEYPKRPIEKEN